MVKIIFLDIDGVLTSRKSLYTYGNFRTFLPSSVEALNFLLKASGAKIVISSGFRMGRSLETIADYFNQRGIDGSKIIGKTPRFQGLRGMEIHEWLYHATIPIESFVILDDETDMGRHISRLVKTSLELGMDMSHAKLAIKMLNQKVTLVGSICNQ